MSWVLVCGSLSKGGIETSSRICRWEGSWRNRNISITALILARQEAEYWVEFAPCTRRASHHNCDLLNRRKVCRKYRTRGRAFLGLLTSISCFAHQILLTVNSKNNACKCGSIRCCLFPRDKMFPLVTLVKGVSSNITRLREIMLLCMDYLTPASSTDLGTQTTLMQREADPASLLSTSGSQTRKSEQDRQGINLLHDGKQQIVFILTSIFRWLSLFSFTEAHYWLHNPSQAPLPAFALLSVKRRLL